MTLERQAPRILASRDHPWLSADWHDGASGVAFARTHHADLMQGTSIAT